MEKIKINDQVIIQTGKDKGKQGSVLRIDKKNNRVIVKGINIVKKTLRPTKENPNGGITEKEGYIHRSNISLLNPKTGKAVRVGFEIKDGKKVRIVHKCKTVL